MLAVGNSEFGQGGNGMHGEKQFIVIPTRVDGLDSCGMTSLCFLFPYKIPK